MSDQVTYYLVRFADSNAEDDYQKLLTYISQMDFTSLAHKSATNVVVSYKDNPHILMDLGEFSAKDDLPKRAAVVCQTTPGDAFGFTLLRHVSHKFDYRIFSERLGCYLPITDGLHDVSQRVLDEKITKVFTAKHVTPLFQLRDSYQFYGYIDGGKAVHVLNPGILHYYHEFGVEEGEKSREFSYEIAPSLEQFIALWDRGAIPEHFYEYYEKSKRIINYSGFDVWRVSRKIFIKPYSFTYRPESQSYELYTSSKAALNNADKILPGENLDRALLRMLREWIKIAPDYVRAVVLRDVRYDRDKENRLIPLLTVQLLLPELPKSEMPAEAKRGWVSLKDVVN